MRDARFETAKASCDFQYYLRLEKPNSKAGEVPTVIMQITKLNFIFRHKNTVRRNKSYQKLQCKLNNDKGVIIYTVRIIFVPYLGSTISGLIPFLINKLYFFQKYKYENI